MGVHFMLSSLICFVTLLLFPQVSSWLIRGPAWKCGRNANGLIKNVLQETKFQLVRLTPRAMLAAGEKRMDVPIESEYEKSLVLKGEELDDTEMSIPKLINNIIDKVITFSATNKDLSGFDPSLLLDNAHILTSGRVYESVMNDRLEAAREGSGEDTSQLEKVDALLQGFVSAERKQRARLKITYILAGAESGRLNEGIALLSESGEIDDDLMKYLDKIIKKELLKAMGPGATLNEDISGAMTADRNDSEDESFEAGVKATLSVLRMVQKLLQAELKTEKKAEVRLLSALLEEKDPEARYVRIKTALTKIEQLEEFAAFLTDGVAYLKARQSPDRRADSSPDEQRREVKVEKEAQLPAGVVEQMKDILLDVQAVRDRLKTGMQDGDVYSSDTGDYADKGPY